VEFEKHQLSEVQGTATPNKLEKLLQDMRANRVAIKGKLNAPMEVKGELNSYEMERRRQMDFLRMWFAVSLCLAVQHITPTWTW